MDKAIKLLEDYRIKEAKIEDLEQEIIFIKDNRDIKGINYDGVSTSPTNEINSIVENAVISSMEKVDYLEHLIKKEMVDINRIVRALEKLDEVERQIVADRYIDGKQWHVVARKSNYSERHCKRLGKQALLKISKEI